MNAVIFGATGMVGSGVLQACLSDGRVASVLVVGRSACGVSHPKLKEILHDDFFDYYRLRADLRGLDVCFFCLGVSAAGMSETDYDRLTRQLTLAAASALLEASPGMVFCYLSGAGAYSSEKGTFMWARVKGRTENELLRKRFRAAYMFRPAYIHPVHGVRSKTRLYRIGYAMAGPFYPALRRIFPKLVTTSEDVGKAMITVAAYGFEGPILETEDINRLS